MIVKNALKHSVLGMLGARKSGLVFWETLTIVSQSKNTSAGHRMPVMIISQSGPKIKGLINVSFE